MCKENSIKIKINVAVYLKHLELAFAFLERAQKSFYMLSYVRRLAIETKCLALCAETYRRARNDCRSSGTAGMVIVAPRTAPVPRRHAEWNSSPSSSVSVAVLCGVLSPINYRAALSSGDNNARAAQNKDSRDE